MANLQKVLNIFFIKYTFRCKELCRKITSLFNFLDSKPQKTIIRKTGIGITIATKRTFGKKTNTVLFKEQWF